MMVRIQLNILQSKLFDSFQYIIIFMLSLVCYLLLVIKISIILIDSTTLQLCWNMYHVCLEFVQKAIPCCRCIDCANFSKNCRNDSKITTFAKYRQWSLLQMQYGMWKRCWYKIWKHKKNFFISLSIFWYCSYFTVVQLQIIGFEVGINDTIVKFYYQSAIAIYIERIIQYKLLLVSIMNIYFIDIHDVCFCIDSK